MLAFVRVIHNLIARVFSLAPDAGYQSAGTYMEGVFALELRRDLLCHSHAQHPDLKKTFDTDNRQM